MTDVLAALTDVEVDYPRRGRALGPFSLALKQGEIVALTGPSGCGKSTALRLFAGLERPTRGTAVRHLARGETSLVFQAPTLIPWASASNNVALPLELAGVATDERRTRAAAALARVGLADAGEARLDAAVRRHGHAGVAGARHRHRTEAAVARRTFRRPRFRHPPRPDRRRASSLVAFQAGHLFVTHDVEEAAYLAERVVVMTPGPGRIAAEIATRGPIPRPDGFRAAADFRETAEAIAHALGDAMGRAA